MGCPQEHLAASAPLVAMLKRQKSSGKLVAAICASPAVVFHVRSRSGTPSVRVSSLTTCCPQAHGLLTPADEATCYPSFASRLENQEKIGEAVVVSGK